MTEQTRSQRAAADVVALLKARNSIIWVVTREEARAERYLVEAAAAANYVPRTWDVAQGVCEINGAQTPGFAGQDPDSVLDGIRTRSGANSTKPENRGVWIMRDLAPWVTGAIGFVTCRRLRNLARLLPGIPRPNDSQAVVVLTPSAEVPAELAGHAVVIEWPMPDRAEIASILDATIAGLPEVDAKTGEPIRAAAAPNGTRDAAIDAAIGLSGEEAASCYARSLVQTRRIDPAAVAGEKKRIIARSGVLEYYDPLPGGLESIGGLDLLKSWLTTRGSAYSPAARAYGLPAPKGCLLVGIPGCGKSLTAKAIATAWGVPLLRLDLGAIKSKFVGESESNIRKAFSVIESVGRCVVWLDEVEKALQGATSGSSDGGTSADALGAILSWMQERQGSAFVVATANDVTSLPPELLRKGRFDEIWSIDLPNEVERREILAAAMRSYGRGGAAVDAESVSAACKDFTGSEVAAIIPDALYAAFADGAREITTSDLMTAANMVTPLIKTAPEKITALRQWAESRARPATSPLVTAPRVAVLVGRSLDI